MAVRCSGRRGGRERGTALFISYTAVNEPWAKCVAVTHEGTVTLTRAPEDIEEFNALPRLPRVLPEDFEPPSLILTDTVTGRTYWVARARYGLAYADDMTDDWEEFLAKDAGTGSPSLLDL